jgi:hypothetical protein
MAFAMMAFAMLGLAPSIQAADEDTQAQLKAMQDRMQAMEDQLQSANKRVEEQTDLIQRSGLTETRGASSGLPGFLGSIDIGGWVAASYFYNVNDPNDTVHFQGTTFNQAFTEPRGLQNTNVGTSGDFYPLHPDHNSFSLDQLWFEIERKVSEENRAGFRADILYGTTAALLNGGGPTSRGCFSTASFGNNVSFVDSQGGCNPKRDSTTSLYIQQAYIQYLMPIGSGITLKAGKFGDLLGVERAGTIYNWNITRGTIWTLFEPINHVGVSVGGPIGDSGFDWILAGVNGFNPDSPDRNDEKSVTGHIGWHNDTITVAANGIIGAEQTGNDGHHSGVANGLIKWTPNDRFSMYLNGDWAMSHPGDRFPEAWGLSLAGRYGITDRTGIALRAEYATDNQNAFGTFGANPNYTNLFGSSSSYNTFTSCKQATDSFGVPIQADNCGIPTNIETYGITATLDHLLTDQLMVRAEGRYDWIHKGTGKDDEFFKNGRYFNQYGKSMPNDQLTFGVELVYNFNKFAGAK